MITFFHEMSEVWVLSEVKVFYGIYIYVCMCART